MADLSSDVPFETAKRYWRVSKYLIPNHRTALNLRGAAPPRFVASYDQLAERYPEQVQSHELGFEAEWEEFSFSTLHHGEPRPRLAAAELPCRRRVMALRESSVVGRQCCVLGPENTLVAEFGYFLPDNDRRRFRPLNKINPHYWCKRWLMDLRHRSQIPAVSRLPGTAVVLNNPWCHNFYHWLLEVAPRIMLLRQAGMQADWYIVDCQSRYQRQVLELLDVPLERCVQPHFGLHLRADLLLRPSDPAVSSWQAMARTIIQSLPQCEGTSENVKRRIYISRKAAAHRKVANEDRLESYLASQGFEICCFEQMDFRKQVERIHRAEIIVAVHGAALANLIFARPGTRVIEICPENRRNPDCFPRISHKLGHQHMIVMASSTRFRQKLSVNLDDVVQALQSCISESIIESISEEPGVDRPGRVSPKGRSAVQLPRPASRSLRS